MWLQNVYDFVFDDDVQNKVMVKNSYYILSFLAVYVLFVKWVGPALMRHRKPFKLKEVIIVYNFSQMALNFIIAYQLLTYGYKIWDDRCIMYESVRFPEMKQNLNIKTWYVLLVRMADCMDTVFFVLRKKDNQITFLHIFHHTSICIIGHIYVKYLLSGYYLLLSVALNSIVHVVMYFYYALAAIGPSVQKYLWWKKYLTLLQMIQFSMILFYMIVSFVSGCERLREIEAAFTIVIGVIFILFINFYMKSFKKHIE